MIAWLTDPKSAETIGPVRGTPPHRGNILAAGDVENRRGCTVAAAQRVNRKVKMLISPAVQPLQQASPLTPIPEGGGGVAGTTTTGPRACAGKPNATDPASRRRKPPAARLPMTGSAEQDVGSRRASTGWA